MAAIGGLLAIGRLLLFILVAVFFFCLLLVISVFYKSKERKLERGILLRRFAIRILHPILGSKITVYGKEPVDSGLIVSNHRSYFDPMVILKNNLASPVGKKEVESWPLIGSVTKTTGVIFVNREEKTSRTQTLKEVRLVLENGFSIFIAPEGTTHIKPTTIDFRPGSFVLAAELGVPVMPVAIDYKNMDDAWIGDDTFIPHFLKCFSKWRTEIKVSYLEPIISSNAEELISVSKNQIDQELIRFRKDWNSIN
ncbi:MAG: lysophospholipid acyltransferase family protein [Lutibacter sp.]|jgi:1-acyl-sn-glycerol-3-phosphate acyltransferase|nr:lysophospholipid acyltransferase family protein [Lutibacter sp.]